MAENKIGYKYNGTIEQFKATDYPTTHADKTVYILGDAEGNGKGVFVAGDYMEFPNRFVIDVSFTSAFSESVYDFTDVTGLDANAFQAIKSATETNTPIILKYQDNNGIIGYSLMRAMPISEEEYYCFTSFMGIPQVAIIMTPNGYTTMIGMPDTLVLSLSENALIKGANSHNATIGFNAPNVEFETLSDVRVNAGGSVDLNGESVLVNGNDITTIPMYFLGINPTVATTPTSGFTYAVTACTGVGSTEFAKLLECATKGIPIYVYLTTQTYRRSLCSVNKLDDTRVQIDYTDSGLTRYQIVFNESGFVSGNAYKIWNYLLSIGG